MANTPLELYEDAYRLHYHEKKIPEAVKVYEAIIRDFPDSNECGYAVIQLQKVKAHDITKALKKGATTLYPLVIIAFMSSFIALLVAIVGTLFIFQQLRIEHHRSTLAIAALSKLSCGKDDEASKLIDEMKSTATADILALELSSDLQSKQPAARTAVAAASTVTLADTGMKTAAPAGPAGRKNVYTMPDKPVARPKPNVPARRAAARPARTPVIVNTDSLSYF